jgi:hypothetical protein
MNCWRLSKFEQTKASLEVAVREGLHIDWASKLSLLILLIYQRLIVTLASSKIDRSKFW